jgi:hypothetical protein
MQHLTYRQSGPSEAVFLFNPNHSVVTFEFAELKLKVRNFSVLQSLCYCQQLSILSKQSTRIDNGIEAKFANCQMINRGILSPSLQQSVDNYSELPFQIQSPPQQRSPVSYGKSRNMLKIVDENRKFVCAAVGNSSEVIGDQLVVALFEILCHE